MAYDRSPYPNTPGCIGYDETKPATYSGSNPGIPLDQEKRPEWATGRQEYSIINDQSVFQLSVHCGNETFSTLSEPTRQHTLDKEMAAALLRALADRIERTI